LKIQAERLDDSDNKTPFLWLVTDRPDTRSATLSDFLPAEYLKVIVCAPVVQQKATVKASKSVKTLDSTTTEQIAQVILKEIPVGAFKSTDCQKIIIKHFPQNPLAKLSGANFGTQFTKTIWPLLKKHGVLEPNPNKRPRKYEMTKDTKGKL